MNPFMVNQSTNMYGISPITQALAQSMALGLQSYQQARQAKATELANILAMTREREKEERARKWKLEDIEAERKYKTSERIAGETAEKTAKEKQIRLQAELKSGKSEETDLQKQKRADSYLGEIDKIILKDGEITSENVSIIKCWIEKYNEISDKPLMVKIPPTAEVTYKMLKTEYPQYADIIEAGENKKLTSEETLNEIATEIIKKERAKEMGWWEKVKETGYKPSTEALMRILGGYGQPPSIELRTPEELSQPVQTWKSVIP